MDRRKNRAASTDASADSTAHANQTLLRAVIDQMPDVFVLKDAKGDFLLCNRTVAKLYNTTPEAMIGKHDDDFGVPKEQADFFRQNVLDIMARGEPEVVYENSTDAVTGETRHFRSIKTPIKDPEGRNQIIVTAQDITEIIRAQEQVAESEARLQHVLEMIHEGVWDWDVKSGTLVHNRQWFKILQIPAQNLHNSYSEFIQLIHPEDQKLVHERITPLLDGREESYSSEHRMIRTDGSVIWVMDRGRVIKRDEQGRALRLVGSFVDITEHRQYQKNLQRATQEAKLANRAKSEFLANMSHEIRTPLNGIIGVIELLKKSSLNTEQQDLIDMASSAASSLLSIISDILDFSKIEARRMELECHPFDLHALFDEVARLFRQLSQERHLDFNVSVDHQLPRWVNGDRNRVRQILFNYLNNALKFTETGQISLNASAADGDYILLEVIDTGIGISVQKQQLLFEDFSQADKSTTRKYGGTGLGLAICKKLAQLMNGKVGVVSETGKGSRFWVKLQLPPAIAENERKDGMEYSLKGMHVLLVEDNKINQMVARKQLEKFDAKVSIAENGEEAVEVALTGDFDVLLMDCQMPVKDGFAATLELRQSGYQKPIIALTANATTDDRQRCLDVGMNDYLSKPFKSETLYALLLEWYDSPSV